MATRVSERKMTSSLFNLVLCVLVFGLSSSKNSSVCEAQAAVPAIYMFGDSLVDVGNNNHLTLSLAKADFPHNGVDYPTGKPTGRFSNGFNAADFLAQKLGLPTGPPYLSLVSKSKKLGDTNATLTGISFASGGAGIFNGTDELFKQSIPLTKQVEYFSLVHDEVVQQLGSAAAEKHFSKSIFAVVIGSNDLFGYFNNNSKISRQYTPQQYVDLMASTLKGLLKRLYSLGARKYVVTGVGVIGCCPAQRKQNKTDDCKVEANYWSTKYNEALKSLLHGLKSESSDINYSYFDTYGVMNNLIQKPDSYGFSEIKEACCGLGNLKADIPCIPISTYCSNRKDHLFWDLYHPTEKASSIFSDIIYSGSQQYIVPMNVKQLIAV